jgi:hypothetical protein
MRSYLWEAAVIALLLSFTLEVSSQSSSLASYTVQHAQASDISTGYDELGCYPDASDPVLRYNSTNGTTNDAQSCAADCSTQGFRLSAFEPRM